MEAIEIKNIAGGALQAKFNKAMEAVVANLLDPNTPSKDKRKITIEMTFVTDEERTQVASTVSVKQKLAPLHPINTQFGIGKDLKDGGNFIEEYGQHLPGQMALNENVNEQTINGQVVDTDTGEVLESKVVDYRKRGAM